MVAMQQQDLTLIRGQRREESGQFIAGLDGSRRPHVHRLLWRTVEREQACSPLTYPSSVQSLVTRDGEQPAAKIATGTVPEALLDDGNHRVLERVRCVVGIS